MEPRHPAGQQQQQQQHMVPVSTPHFYMQQQHAMVAATGPPHAYGAPYQPQKLYWAVFPKRLIKFFVLTLRVTRRDPTKFGRNGDIDLKEIAAHDYPATTHVNIRPYYPIKQEASVCHPSQLSGGPARFGPSQEWCMMTEDSRRGEPAANGRRLKERDLFEGVKVSS
jgi:hypothetical protein